MTKREMIDELLERFEGELEELSNAQLTALVSEYEHTSLLDSMVENLGVLEDDEVTDDEVVDEEEELPLLDEEWEDPDSEDE